MNKYLLQILHEINTIIIPGLGALTVTNSKTGEIMFMGFLKHEDGNFAKYISEKEGISENDAKNMIAKFVREITIQLDKGDSYDMYQFGRFIKINGEITFENWDKYAHSDEQIDNVLIEDEIKVEDNKIEEQITETPVVEQSKEEEKSEEIHIASKSLDEILENKEEVLPEEIPAQVEVEKNPEKITEIVVKKEEIVENEKLISAETPQQEEQEKDNKTEINTIKSSENAGDLINKVELKKKIKENSKVKVVKEKKKKSKGFYILIVLLFLIAAGSVGTIVFYDTIEKALFSPIKEKVSEKVSEKSSENELEEIENQVELEAEKVIEENEVTEEVSSPEVKEEAVSSPVNNGNLAYHIIAGGFGSEDNANRLAKKYQAEGKNASVLGKFDQLYLVAYESFASKEEANAALKSSAVKGWIFKYEK